mmetsp:Transcript_26314/g.42813  ORF Transcript_26314/g.42813 Transcript_26314/m.42813 type:complete len:309 (+) Transcript_26314:234-1160(+)|eukprot:CAMPEP_0196173662 /NCGR_PEP_ID=MMETSP0911-20130528/6927_1 /TAXON_ID=49265 /ORGANISM="Thalassiosira rotula, Strain GSO102" /LENGTH=308 /DNA_ID=CAMNT_0041440901 /DNA_START=218 /DNA_END=1144 /DNA_ORIENTATION=+
MPISIKDGFPVKHHSHSWTTCLASHKESAIGAIRHILDPRRGGYHIHINKLVAVRNESGVSAIKVAAPKQEEINKYLLFCGRYEIQPGAPEHWSATSIVLRAIDRSNKIDYRAIFDEADKDNSNTLTKEELSDVAKRVGLSEKLFRCEGESIDYVEFIGICVRELGDGYPRVVVKLMQDEEQWKREKHTRKNYEFDPKYVMGELEGVPSGEVICKEVKELKGGLGAIKQLLPDGINLGTHAIIMEAADRNLNQIYLQERPNINTLRGILQQVFEAVAHMHKQGLMHGDIKMLNNVRSRVSNRFQFILL